MPSQQQLWHRGPTLELKGMSQMIQAGRLGSLLSWHLAPTANPNRAAQAAAQVTPPQAHTACRHTHVLNQWIARYLERGSNTIVGATHCLSRGHDPACPLFGLWLLQGCGVAAPPTLLTMTCSRQPHWQHALTTSSGKRHSNSLLLASFCPRGPQPCWQSSAP